MKKLMSFGVLAVLAVMATNTVFADTTTPNSQIPNNPKAQLSAADKAKADAKQKQADAYMAHLKANQKTNTSSINPSYVPGPTEYVLGVAAHQENPGWNCGPAATLQDANYYNPTNPYYQSSNDNPYNEPSQYNLQTLEKTTQTDGTYCVNIPTPLNEASGTGSFYVATNITSQSQLTNDIVSDKDNGYPMIADVATSRLDYYNGTQYLHYISVDGYDYDSSSGTYPDAHVVDDNWNNTYYGAHWTSMSGLYSAVAYFGSNPNFIW